MLSTLYLSARTESALHICVYVYTACIVSDFYSDETYTNVIPTWLTYSIKVFNCLYARTVCARTGNTREYIIAYIQYHQSTSRVLIFLVRISLEAGETPWLLRTAIRQQTTGQRQELRDLPQASSSRRHPPSQNPLDKELCGVKSNNSSDIAGDQNSPGQLQPKLLI